jgi:hypothetical protein
MSASKDALTIWEIEDRPAANAHFWAQSILFENFNDCRSTGRRKRMRHDPAVSYDESADSTIEKAVG